MNCLIAKNSVKPAGPLESKMGGGLVCLFGIIVLLLFLFYFIFVFLLQMWILKNKFCSTSSMLSKQSTGFFTRKEEKDLRCPFKDFS